MIDDWGICAALPRASRITFNFLNHRPFRRSLLCNRVFEIRVILNDTQRPNFDATNFRTFETPPS